MQSRLEVLFEAARRAAPCALIAIMMGAGAGLALAAGGPLARVPPPPVPQDQLPDPNDPEAATPKPPSPAQPPADPEKVAAGQRLYKDMCQKCHGVNMVSPGGGFFDLRTFPHDEKPRFVNSVTNGKRAMPAWGAYLKPTDIDLLWAYISTGGAVPVSAQ